MQSRSMPFALGVIFCATAYAQMAPTVRTEVHEMTVDEARTVVLAILKPPAMYDDSNDKTNDIPSFISEASALPKFLRFKAYNKAVYLALAHINPTMDADDPDTTIIRLNGHEEISETLGLSIASVGVSDRGSYPLLDKRVAHRFLDALLVLKGAANRVEKNE